MISRSTRIIWFSLSTQAGFSRLVPDHKEAFHEQDIQTTQNDFEKNAKTFHSGTPPESIVCAEVPTIFTDSDSFVQGE